MGTTQYAFLDLFDLFQGLLCDIGIKGQTRYQLNQRLRNEGLGFLTITLPSMHDSFLQFLEMGIVSQKNFKNCFGGHLSWCSPLGRMVRKCVQDEDPELVSKLRQLFLTFKKMEIDDDHDEQRKIQNTMEPFYSDELALLNANLAVERDGVPSEWYVIRDIFRNLYPVLGTSIRTSNLSEHPSHDISGEIYRVRPEMVEKGGFLPITLSNRRLCNLGFDGIQRRNFRVSSKKNTSISHASAVLNYTKRAFACDGPGTVSTLRSKLSHTGDIRLLSSRSNCAEFRSYRSLEALMGKVSPRCFKLDFIKSKFFSINNDTDKEFFECNGAFEDSDTAELLLVPKDTRKKRVIMRCPVNVVRAQQKFLSSFKRVLKDQNPLNDLNDQTYQQQRALIGSTDKSLSTIDLSRASDRFSRSFVDFIMKGTDFHREWSEVQIFKSALPSDSPIGIPTTMSSLSDVVPHWYVIQEDGKTFVRSGYGYKNYTDKEVCLWESQKAFAMGQPQTMPLMMMILVAIYVASTFQTIGNYYNYKLVLSGLSDVVLPEDVFKLKDIMSYVENIPKTQLFHQRIHETARLMSVYGDDIIIPTDGFDSMIEWLQKFDLIPNRGKSFSKSFFREACGMDAYKGYDVTPIKLQGGSFIKGHSPLRLTFSPEDCGPVLVSASRNFWENGMYSLSAKLVKGLTLSSDTNAINYHPMFALSKKCKPLVPSVDVWNNPYASDEVLYRRWLLKNCSDHSPEIHNTFLTEKHYDSLPPYQRRKLLGVPIQDTIYGSKLWSRDHSFKPRKRVQHSEGKSVVKGKGQHTGLTFPEVCSLYGVRSDLVIHMLARK